MYERQLNDIDVFAHQYYTLMDDYFPLPSFEDVILDKLEKQYGQDTINNYLAIFTSYYNDQEQEMTDQNEEAMEINELLKEEPPKKVEKMMQQEQKFRNLCNLMCTMTGSLAISCCNILASPLAEKQYQNVLNMLTATSMAHLYSSRAVSELFPNRLIPSAIAYAKRSRKHTAIAASLLQNITDNALELSPVFQPIKTMFEKAMKAIGDFITESNQLSDEDFD